MKRIIRAVVITASDTRTPENDLSGDALAELLEGFGAMVIDRRVVADDRESLGALLAGFADSGEADLIITTGGTGLGPRDVTPEATLDVIDREAPGIAEAIRRETAAKAPGAMLSRGVAGVSGATLIINFPGSPKAVAECFEVIRPVLQHAVDLVAGDTEH
jgi:molybdopterin adenylyltransferase